MYSRLIVVNCWPTANGASSDVNIDFELQDTSLELQDVKIRVPLPANSDSPKINSIDGNYKYDRLDLCLVPFQLCDWFITAKNRRWSGRLQ